MSDYSKEVLAGFVEEAKSYLPIIEGNAKKYAKSRSKDREELIEEAYRHAHTIKGAAAMIGLSPLSHIAYYLEDVLADISAGQLSISDAKEYIRQSVSRIDQYLDGILPGTVNESDILIRATREYNVLRGLPTDDASVEEVIAQVAGGSEIEFNEAAASDLADLEQMLTMEEVPDLGIGSSVPTMITFDEEFMAELREAFQEEAEDHLGNTARLLTHLQKHPNDKEQLRELRRVIHTLKGAAATVGITPMAKLTHRMEDLLDHIDEVGANVSRPVMDLMFESADMLEDQLQGDTSETKLSVILSRYDGVLVNGSGIALPQSDMVNVQQYEIEKSQPVAAPQPVAAAPVPEPTPVAPARAADEQVPTPLRVTSEVVRVPLERLDELVRLTSEWVITRTTFEQRINDLTRYVNEIAPSLDRLQRISNRLDTDYQEMSYASQNAGGGQIVAFAGGSGNTPADDGGGTISAEFDALEFDRYTELYGLSRDLSETTNDIKTTHNDLRSLLADFDSILTRQSRVSSEVQDKLMRTRMVPLSTIVTRLQRAVRVVARKRNKQVDLVIEGEHIELDKKVLEDIADPLLHLLRNSVDHGIEPSELRMVTGKEERGTIYVRAYYEGNQVVIQVKDDGAGIDINKIRAKALASGYMMEADEIADDELRQLIFHPGFSTADEVTDVSGRGVGMDAVKTSVGRLKGTIHLASEAGAGTTFSIRLPLTLAVMRGLLVKARGTEYALPLSSVAQIVRLDGEAVSQIGVNPVVHVGENILPVVQLAELLGGEATDLSDRKRIPVLIINAGNQQIAMIVDEIIEGREIVIKTLGNHLRYVHGVTGATLMGDGRVVLILNPPELVSEPKQQQARQWAPATPSEGSAVSTKKRVLDILVVDDSVSVRKVVANMVGNAGWQPRMARDGLEALEMIQSGAELPDAILLDIEMPRMNGYELTATLRANDAYRNIPIVMLTSRAGEKHRSKAFELGVNDYLVKPYREDELLEAVRKVTQ